MSYLHEHFHEDMTLAHVAKRARLSSCHFSRLFRQLVGQTYVAYLTNLRVARAKALLAETPHRLVTAIGFEVGFGSLRSFEVHFKRVVGVTPLKYRWIPERASPTRMSPIGREAPPQDPACHRSAQV
ncbi:MAG: helix-turn-helix transcriptional regulator [Gemmatimonadota bacterium]|nr:MAG: helix-turn-helix transcriptional regulator [Gemmatimonadota bacterium]